MIIEWIQDVAVSEELIRTMQAAADQCPIREGIPMPCSVCVRLCDDAEIRRVNAACRGLDRATDVLSFPTVTYPAGQTAGDCPNLLRGEYDDGTGACFLGDILISVPHMAAQALEYGHSEAREAAYLLVHGICHLMGYDHMTEEDQRRMRRMEERILTSVSLERTAEGTLSAADQELIEAAARAMEQSYSPYSHYPVGAAIRTEDGRVFTGCNIENASFGLTMCAERTAAFKAVSEGARVFETIAIVGMRHSWPCGACRQVLNEFSPKGLRVLIAAKDYPTEQASLADLLPHSFGPADLGVEE